jgi:hydroxymethylpyrimidine pyrophosphatase-like HAD family hydrolase
VRIQALATDYDGTIAHHGTVAQETLAGLAALREGGRCLILVSGRQLEDLQKVGPDLTTFDMVVAENGAVLFDPRRQELEPLAEAPPPALLDALRQHGVPFDRGHVVVATSVPHDAAVLRAIRDLGIEWQISYNKGAVMTLPAGVTKASGLSAALDRLGLSIHNVAGIGDAENDHNFLRDCEVAAATGNALLAIKQRADLVMRRANGRGVAEFIQRYLLNDLAGAQRVFDRYRVELGTSRDGAPWRTPVYGSNPLILGSSGGGKSTLAGLLVERLTDQGYQVCVVDPEGDHTSLDPLVMVGSADAGPTLEEIEIALERANRGIIVNLVALGPADKARFSADLLAALLAMRASRGRPHWLVLDEAHHLLPADGSPGTYVLPAGIDGICMITLHAKLISTAVLQHVTQLLVVGEDARQQAEGFAATRGLPAPTADRRNDWSLLEGEALAVPVTADGLGPAQRFRVASRRTEHARHVRKYAGGDLGDSSFYFRGPDGHLNLRAYNVTAWVEMARGIDLATWTFHLQRGDYERWFRDNVKDPELAGQIAQIEHNSTDQDAEASREQILRLVGGRYTAGG